MEENEISYSPSEPWIRFVIWIVISFISLTVFYLLAQENGGELWGMVSVNSRFITVNSVLLFFFMFFAEALQKQDTWVMIGINLFIGFSLSLFWLVLLIISCVGSDGLGIFLSFFALVSFLPLGIITTINAIAVRIHYLICRHLERTRRQSFAEEID
ncbi:MAG: hypothetical protein IKI11_03990 [Neisseriaceae bacterium]|nr:hypothetical protein [Neisseriaceae bacterium]